MKFPEKQKWCVYSLFLCLTWYIEEIFATGENQGIFLHKVSSNKLVEMETTPCLIKTVNVLNRLECTYRCINQLPECAAIYYNDVSELCKLLRCRPTDKLGNENLVEIPSGWEIWEDTEGDKKNYPLLWIVSDVLSSLFLLYIVACSIIHAATIYYLQFEFECI